MRWITSMNHVMGLILILILLVGAKGSTAIDITGEADPFNLIMAEIVDRLIEDGATCPGIGKCVADPDSDTPHVLNITGNATVTYTDFHDMGDYRAGLLFCGGNGKTGNYPNPYAGGTGDGDEFLIDYDGEFIIDFGDMSLTVDQTGADKRLVPIKFGCGYDVGWRFSSAGAAGTKTLPYSGSRFQGIVVKGNPVIKFTGSVEDGTWLDGHIPSVNTNTDTLGTTTHASEHSSIAIWEARVVNVANPTKADPNPAASPATARAVFV